MSTVTLGTVGTTTLTALRFVGALAPADITSIANGVKHDKIVTTPIYPGAFAQSGLLYIPSRGVLQVQPGDYVALDATGWPILLSQAAAASASWVHT